MEALFGTAAGSVGILIWLLWAFIGLFEAFGASRVQRGRILWADTLAGVLAAMAGGYFCIDFVGDSPTQRLLVSILGAVFLCTAVLWITGRLLIRK